MAEIDGVILLFAVYYKTITSYAFMVWVIRCGPYKLLLLINLLAYLPVSESLTMTLTVIHWNSFVRRYQDYKVHKTVGINVEQIDSCEFSATNVPFGGEKI